jgi:hypothetical protein
MFCFHAYGQVSQTKKNHIIFSFKEFFFKKTYVFACIIDFNNQFVKVIRTRPIFQKIQKIIFFLLIVRITRLYIRCSLDIKKYFFIDVRMIRFYPMRQKSSYQGELFFNPRLTNN